MIAHSNKLPPLIVVMLGPPGSGKGTQATMLQKKLNIPHISTGDLLRDHVRQKTELGQQVLIFMDQGKLVPDQLILDMLSSRVSQPDCLQGYILDGFPRTLHQAESLQQSLQAPNLIVFNLNLSDTIIIKRLTHRIVCSQCGASYHLHASPPKNLGICDRCATHLTQRSDDTEEIIAKRLTVYHAQTAPLVTYYTHLNLLHHIDCNQPKEAIFSDILMQLKLYPNSCS